MSLAGTGGITNTGGSYVGNPASNGAAMTVTLQSTAGDLSAIGFQLLGLSGVSGFNWTLQPTSRDLVMANFLAGPTAENVQIFRQGSGGQIEHYRRTAVFRDAGGGATAYQNATLRLLTHSSHTGPVGIGFERQGQSGAALYHNGSGVSTLRVIDSAGVDGAVWWGGAQGSGTGMDSDKVDGAHAGNANGNVGLANGVVCINLNANLLNGIFGGNGSGNLSINNGTVNTNLNADMVDGAHAGNASGNVGLANTTRCVDLNADMVDGIHGAAFAQLASSPSFSGDVTAPNFVASGQGYGFGAGGVFTGGSASGEIGWVVGGATRFHQTSSTALFLTPGTYTTSWTVASDRRLKTDIEPIGSALDRLVMLRPISYIPSAAGIREGMTRGVRLPGLIAQELADVFPDLVGHRPGVDDPTDDFLTADMIGLVPYILAGLVELRDDMRTISARLASS